MSLLPLLIRSIPRFHARRFLPMGKGSQAFFPPLQPSMLRTSLQGRPPQSPWRFIAPFHSFRRSTKLTPSRRPYNKKSATPAVISRRHQRSLLRAPSCHRLRSTRVGSRLVTPQAKTGRCAPQFFHCSVPAQGCISCSTQSNYILKTFILI